MKKIRDQKENRGKSEKVRKRYTSFLFPIILVMVLLTLGSVIFFQMKMKTVGVKTADDFKRYTRHYAMIAEDDDTGFWESVYEGAKKEGQLENIYVERFGQDLNTKYSREELVQIAIDAGVDGIILDGTDDPDMVTVVDNAVAQGIPVITVKDDCYYSRRQGFVGISSYNLGQEYGNQLLKILTDNTETIDVLMDASQVDSGQDIVITGISDAIQRGLGAKNKVKITGVTVDSTDAFGAEETIRDIFVDSKNMPDAIVCLNAVYTKCAFQAAVDYNKVGKVSLLGYYDSPDILDAVSKNILQSTISVDTKRMGRMCVDALSEYQNTGYVSNYLSVDAEMITQQDAVAMLASEEEAETGEQP